MLVTSMMKKTVTVEAEPNENLSLGSDGYCIQTIVLDCPVGDPLRDKLKDVFSKLLDISDEHESYNALRETRMQLLNELLKYPVHSKSMVFVGVPKNITAENWLSKSVLRLTYKNEKAKYLYEIEKVNISKAFLIDHLTTDEYLKVIEDYILKNISSDMVIIDLPEWLETERDICFENYNYRKREEQETSPRML